MGAASPNTPVGVVTISRVARDDRPGTEGLGGIQAIVLVGPSDQLEDLEGRVERPSGRVEFEHDRVGSLFGGFRQAAFERDESDAVDGAVDRDDRDLVGLSTGRDRANIGLLRHGRRLPRAEPEEKAEKHRADDRPGESAGAARPAGLATT